MHAQTETTWILISDASRARLFTRERPGLPLQLLQEFSHPESRASNHELTTDRPGRVHQSAKPGHRSAMEAHTEPKTVEHENFARELAAALYKGATSNAYERVFLTAPPHFLGILRDALDETVRKRVSGSMDKDYTSLDVKELTERIQESLTAPSLS